MRSREDVAKFAADLIDGTRETTGVKGDKVHFGLQEVRDLMDYIYEGEPQNEKEEVRPWIGNNL